jgi:hypothetical protein
MGGPSWWAWAAEGGAGRLPAEPVASSTPPQERPITLEGRLQAAIAPTYRILRELGGGGVSREIVPVSTAGASGDPPHSVLPVPKP